MPFLITLLAGCSTLIGYLFIYLKNTKNSLLIASLGFASGVMFFISIFDLIPNGFLLINKYYYPLFSFLIATIIFLCGIIIAGLLNKKETNTNNYDSYLYHIGIVSMIAIILHNIPEGIATYLTTSFDLKLGIGFAIALALHNIPEGISISIPIYYSTRSKKKTFIYTLISGISEFIGAIIASIFLKDFNSPLFMGSLYLLIAGIMIYISLGDLLPSSIRYRNKKLTYLFFIIGIIFIYISSILLK